MEIENPHTAVKDLVTKLHANIDSIHACISSLSDTSSHDAELERLEVEREQKIQELRKAHEDAVKALADQRLKEKQEIEEKRRKETEELEEQRRKEYEELMARRKREDEERKAKMEAEEAERERVKKEEDEKREKEKEDSERTLQEKVEKELEALEDEMERKVEEGKKALRELDEKRKAINAQIDAALNTPTVIPTIHFRSRAKTLSRASRGESISESFPKKEEVVKKSADVVSDDSQDRGIAAEPVQIVDQVVAKPEENKEAPSEEVRNPETLADKTEEVESKDKEISPEPEPKPIDAIEPKPVKSNDGRVEEPKSDEATPHPMSIEKAKSDEATPLSTSEPEPEVEEIGAEPVKDTTLEEIKSNEYPSLAASASKPQDKEMSEIAEPEVTNGDLVENEISLKADSKANDAEPATSKDATIGDTKAGNAPQLPNSELGPESKETSTILEPEHIKEDPVEKEILQKPITAEPVESDKAILGETKSDEAATLLPMSEPELATKESPESEEIVEKTIDAEQDVAVSENTIPDPGQQKDIVDAPTPIEANDKETIPESTESPLSKEQSAGKDILQEDIPKHEESTSSKAIETEAPSTDKSAEAETSVENEKPADDAISSIQEHEESIEEPVVGKEMLNEEKIDSSPTEVAVLDETKNEVPLENHVEHPEDSEKPLPSEKSVASADANEETSHPEVFEQSIDSEAVSETEHEQTVPPISAEGTTSIPEAAHDPSEQREAPEETAEEHVSPDSTSGLKSKAVVSQPNASEHEDSGIDAAVPALPTNDLPDVESDRRDEINVQDPASQPPGNAEHERTISEEKPVAEPSSTQVGEEPYKTQDSVENETSDLGAASQSAEEFVPTPEEEVSESEELSATGLPSKSHINAEKPESEDKELQSEDTATKDVGESKEEVPVEQHSLGVPHSDTPESNTAEERAHFPTADTTPKDVNELKQEDVPTEEHVPETHLQDIDSENKDSIPTSQLEPLHESTEPEHQETSEDVHEEADTPKIAASGELVKETPEQSATNEEPGVKTMEVKVPETLSVHHDIDHPSRMATPELPREGMGEATSTLAIAPETPTLAEFNHDAQLVESANEELTVPLEHAHDSGSGPAGGDILGELEHDETSSHESLDEKIEERSSADDIEHSTQSEELPEESLSQAEHEPAANAPEPILSENVPAHDTDSTQNHHPPAQEQAESALDVSDDHRIGDNAKEGSTTGFDAHLDQEPTTMAQSANHKDTSNESLSEALDQAVPAAIEPENASHETQERNVSADGTPLETPMTSDQFFTPMVEATKDEGKQYPLPDQSRSQEPTPTFPKETTHDESANESSDEIPETTDDMSHLGLDQQKTRDIPLSLDPVSQTIVPKHIIEALDGAGVDSAFYNPQVEIPAESHNETEANHGPKSAEKEHPVHEPIDTSGAFSDARDISQPMTAASSHAETWASAEEEQDLSSEHEQHDETTNSILPANASASGDHVDDQPSPSIHSEEVILESDISVNQAQEKPMPSPLGLGTATMHHSREIDRKPSPQGFHARGDSSHENEYQRAINNVATQPGFTPIERPEPDFEERGRPRTPVQVPHFSERHAESPVTVLNADDLFDDSSDDDEDSFPLGQYQDASPAKSSELQASEPEQTSTDDIADQYFEDARDLDTVPEHEPIHQFGEGQHRNSGLFADLVNVIRPDISLVRQMRDTVDEKAEDYSRSSTRPQSVSFDESAGPFDYPPGENSLHVRTHTADTVPSFESYARSDTPTSPSDAASSPFQERPPHEEPRIQSSWHDEVVVPVDESHQELKPQASPLQAEFDPFNSNANPSHVIPQSSQPNLQAEYDPFAYTAGIDPPSVPPRDIRRSSLSPSPLNTSEASHFVEGRPYDSPVSATQSLQGEPTDPIRPPSSLARKSTTGPLVPSNRTPVSSPSSNSFFQKTRSLFETGAIQQSSTPSTPSPPRPLSGFFSVGRAPPPPPPRSASRPSSLYQAKVPEYNPDEDGEPIVPRSLDGDGKPPSPVFIPSSSPAASSRSGSISSVRKSISKDEDENFSGVVKRASNPFLGGLSRLVGAGSGGLEDSIHNPERSKLLGKVPGAE